MKLSSSLAALQVEFLLSKNCIVFVPCQICHWGTQHLFVQVEAYFFPEGVSIVRRKKTAGGILYETPGGL